MARKCIFLSFTHKENCTIQNMRAKKVTDTLTKKKHIVRIINLCNHLLRTDNFNPLWNNLYCFLYDGLKLKSIWNHMWHSQWSFVFNEKAARFFFLKNKLFLLRIRTKVKAHSLKIGSMFISKNPIKHSHK